MRVPLLRVPRCDTARHALGRAFTTFTCQADLVTAQFCAREDPAQTEGADGRCRMVVDDDAAVCVYLVVPVVRASRVLGFCNAPHVPFTCRSIPRLWPFLILYVIYMFTDKSPEHGGRISPWFRGTKFWRLFAEYYPASCVLRRSSP